MTNAISSAQAMAELQAAAMAGATPDFNAQMAALQATINSGNMARAGAPLPSAAAAPVAPLTQQQIALLLDEAFKRNMPGAHQMSQSFEAVFVKALSAEDYIAFQKYVAAGSPGFTEMLASGKFDPLAQLTWETIKENVK